MSKNRNSRASATAGAAAAVAVLLGVTAVPALAASSVVGPYGQSSARLQTFHNEQFETTIMRHNLYTETGSTYDSTITWEQCGNSSGPACIFRNQETYNFASARHTLTTAWVSNHTHRSRASWNDGENRARFTNAVTPLISR